MAGAQIAETDLPAAVYWGQDVFVIPYQWSPETDPSMATEVVLYGSTDRGVTWQEVTRARPDVRSFVYRAAADGEFCFCVKTLDRNGRSWPAGACVTELRVVVDTSIPRLGKLESSRRGAQVAVEAKIEEPNLDRAAVTIAVRSTLNPDWQSLPVDIQPTAGGATVRASVPSNMTGDFEARLSARDAAGNPAAIGAVFNARLIAESGSPFQSVAASSSGPPPSDAWPARARVESPAGMIANPFDSPHAMAPPSPAPASATAQPGPRLEAETSSGWRSAPADAWPAERDSMPIQTTRAPAPRGGPFRSASLQQTAPTSDCVYSATPRFALEYDLSSVGPWGVERIEVWCTEDGGKTWRQNAIDSDNRSPAHVETPGAGEYGFRIVVHSVGGLDPARPMPGDAPEVRVIVDVTPPEAAITGAAQGEGYFGDHLILRWEASDRQLADRPVTLSYSSRPDGPWSPIAANLENTGRFAWKIQRHLPNAVFIRLEARDAAGNRRAAVTPQPIPVSLPEASGQIRGIRPVAADPSAWPAAR
ncbi:hypothetical protein Pla175_17060 [Pirellulimonas nuda]|uniref:Ser-Thr-rich glycosyl-phosphatidyl-inositol-anchored membrane family protein n=1 Tax=Pirellulimonas nuda TaxID=2528009 RepID=A0A518DA19_9BACT|nr:hypothetical protein [Pirellulimonas nuda]QDU88331.1 hypothetical protein Pla175_17060 [Pirellulimonas nuda]